MLLNIYDIEKLRISKIYIICHVLILKYDETFLRRQATYI